MSELPAEAKDGSVRQQGQGSDGRIDLAQVEERPISSPATTSLSEKPVPPKSVDASDAEVFDEKNVGGDDGGKDADQTDYASTATRKTEFKHFLVY
jgi:hypothetical protein